MNNLEQISLGACPTCGGPAQFVEGGEVRRVDLTPAAGFQPRVRPWMMDCFGAEISADITERNHRFLEEALELVQSTGCSQSEAHQLVDYVFGRSAGEPSQEVGGVMVTLAALCLAAKMDMHAAGETELARISVPEIMAKIRAKQAAKPKHSPLPAAQEVVANDSEALDMPLPCNITVGPGTHRKGTSLQILVRRMQYLHEQFTANHAALLAIHKITMCVAECPPIEETDQLTVKGVKVMAQEIALLQRELATARRKAAMWDAHRDNPVFAAPEKAQEPVLPDLYSDSDCDSWFEHHADANLLENFDPLKVGDEYELNVCWTGKQKFRVVKIADDESDDVEVECIESSVDYYTAPPTLEAAAQAAALAMQRQCAEVCSERITSAIQTNGVSYEQVLAAEKIRDKIRNLKPETGALREMMIEVAKSAFSYGSVLQASAADIKHLEALVDRFIAGKGAGK